MARVTEADVMAALSRVEAPELHRSAVELGMVRDLVIHDDAVSFTLALTVPECPLRDQLSEEAQAAVQALPATTAW